MRFPLLLIGGIVAAIGVNQLARAVFTSLPEPEMMIQIAVVDPETRVPSSRPRVVAEWAPVFGSPQMEDITISLSEPVEEAETVRLELNYRLRGIVVGEDHDIAILEGGNGTEIVRTGGELLDGRKLLEIHQDGVLIESAGGSILIAFLEAEFTALEESSSDVGRDDSVIIERSAPALAVTDVLKDSSSSRALQTAHSRRHQAAPRRFFSTE